MKDIKSMILTMLTVLLALPASAETIVGTLSAEELEEIGITAEKTLFPAGKVILENEAATLELAYNDEWGTITGYGSYSSRTLRVGDSGEIELQRAVVGNANPVFSDYEAGVMSAGAVFKLNAKKTGWMTVLLRMSSNKQYVVFEGRTKGIPYTLGMAYRDTTINYSLPATDLNTIDFDAPDASRYFMTDSVGGYRPQFPTVVAGLGEAPAEATSATGFLTFKVTEGNDYYFSGLGTKVGSAGFVFTDSSAQPTVTFPESEQYSEVNFDSVITLPSLAAGAEFDYEGIRYQVVDSEARTVKTMPIYEEVDSVWVSGYHFNGELAIPARASDGMNEYTVVGVGESSFSGCSEVTSVSLPNTLTFIENRGFDGCSGLTSIDLPSSVEEIGMYFLSSCTALTEITIPEKVTTIKWGAFNGCTSLSEVRLPEGLEEIETNAFIACYNLTAITLPDSLKRIGGAAFAACGLTSIELPSGLEYLGNIAFRGDPLESVTIPASLLEADETPFQYCGYIGEVTYLAERPVAFDAGFFENTVYENAVLNTPNATIADIQATVPWNKFARIQARDGSVGFVEAGTDFEYEGIVYTVLDPAARTCKVKDARNVGQTDVSITEEVIFENRGYTVVEIGDESFAGLANMFSLSLPSTIERIGDGAFEGCERLTSLLWRGSRRMPYELVEAVGNPNLLVYVDRAEYAPEGIDHNVVAEGVCEKLELTPGYAFYPYGEFVANSSRMTKEFTQQTAYDGCAGWETIVVPFDVTRITSPQGNTLLPFAAVSDTRRQRPFWLYEAYEEGEWMEAASIRAGIPYIISMPNNPRYNPAYNVNGTVTFSNPNPQTISREITVPYGVTWNTGHQFLSIWTPLSDAEATEAMGLNANMDTVRDDSGRLLAPGSAFCRGITPKPLEAYVTVSDQSRIFPIRGLQTAVLSLEDEDGLTIVQDGGGVVLKSSEDRTVEIYSADGTLLRRIALKAGEAVNVDGLPQGVCLIAGRKVLIH